MNKPKNAPKYAIFLDRKICILTEILKTLNFTRQNNYWNLQWYPIHLRYEKIMQSSIHFASTHYNNIFAIRLDFLLSENQKTLIICILFFFKKSEKFYYFVSKMLQQIQIIYFYLYENILLWIVENCFVLRMVYHSQFSHTFFDWIKSAWNKLWYLSENSNLRSWVLCAFVRELYLYACKCVCCLFYYFTEQCRIFVQHSVLQRFYRSNDEIWRR